MLTMSKLWRKAVIAVLVLILVLPVMTACDDDDEDYEPFAAAAEVSTATPSEATPLESTEATVATDDPVKIGVMMDYSGPAAMSGFLADAAVTFAEWYWNEKQGGIMVGDVRRPVEFIKYDHKNEVARASAGADKLLLDGVVAITLGGASDQFAFPIADVTDPEKVLFSSFFVSSDTFAQYEYAVGSYYNQAAKNQMIAEFVVNHLHAKSVCTAAYNYDANRKLIDDIKERIAALDPTIEFVCEEYVDAAVKDWSPTLTKIKYKNPDVLIGDTTKDTWAAISEQIMGLGGWGDINVVSCNDAGYFTGIEESPGADGWYISVMFLPGTGIGTPDQLEFIDLWAEKCAADPSWCKKYSPSGSLPLPSTPVLYNPILTAIKAIELAGSDDPAEIAEICRSGKLEFESPLGHMKIGPDGLSNLAGFFIQVKDGEVTPVYGLE